MAEVLRARFRTRAAAATAPPCEYCLTVSGTISGPPDAVAFEVANPIALSCAWLLNAPCMYNPQTEQTDMVPAARLLRAGPVWALSYMVQPQNRHLPRLGRA
jgi:hypothetical protein